MRPMAKNGEKLLELANAFRVHSAMAQNARALPRLAKLS